MIQVSVIIPAYRAQSTIGAAVESALAQTLRDIEVIVVDDGSPDESAAKALEAAAGDSRVRLIRLPENRGVSAARNAGFAAAGGRWVTPLDADDVLAPERLETIVAQADASACDVLIDDLLIAVDAKPPVRAFGTDKLSESGWITATRYADLDRPYFGWRSIGFAKPLFSASFFQHHGVAYREHLHAGEDFDIVMQALLRGARLRFSTYAGYHYRRYNSTLSLAQEERVRAAMVVSSRELQTEATARSNSDAARALLRREVEMLRRFDANDFLTALDENKLRSAFICFKHARDKRYVLIRLAASLRYNAYKAFGITLDPDEKRRKAA